MALMTVLAALRRRWYVVVAGLLASLVLVGQAAKPHGAYETTAAMLFFPPVSRLNPNGYTDGGGNVITAAAFVAVRMQAPEVKADLAAKGMVKDYTVVMHNSGNQFADNFDRAAIDISISGPDPATTSRSLQLVAAEIRSELNAAQSRARADRREWIRTQLSPVDPTILLVPGNRMRAAAAALLLGVALTVLVAIGLDDRLRRRARRQIAASAPDLVAAE